MASSCENDFSWIGRSSLAETRRPSDGQKDAIDMNGQNFLEPLLKILRGNTNSVRYRFFDLPRARLKYSWAKMSGTTWTDHYRTIVDESAASSKLDGAVLDAYVRQAGDYIPLFMKHGMTEQSRFLDYGCGIMRFGVHLVPYLSSGRYAGADISSVVLRSATDLLDKNGIQSDRFDSYWIEDNKLRSLEGKKFDMIWASSVLTHMEIEDIRVLFGSLRAHLAPDGVFCFTFSETEKAERRDLKDFFYPRADIAAAATSAGFSFQIDEDYRGVETFDRFAVARPEGMP